MNLEPLIELNPSEVNVFKYLREENIKQLEIVREDLGRSYNLLDYAIRKFSFIDFSGITRSIFNRGRIIKDLDKKKLKN